MLHLPWLQGMCQRAGGMGGEGRANKVTERIALAARSKMGGLDVTGHKIRLQMADMPNHVLI